MFVFASCTLILFFCNGSLGLLCFALCAVDRSEDAVRREIRESCTLTQFILGCQKKHPTATGNLTLLLTAIQTACKFIAAKVRTAGAHLLLCVRALSIRSLER